MSRETPPSGVLVRVLLVPAVSILLACAVFAAAQVADTTDINAYLHAITQPNPSARVAALESFVATAHPGSLRLDALEWIVWDQMEARKDVDAANWARQLLEADRDNALGLAVTAASSEGTAERGLSQIASLRRPEGMSHDEFVRLHRHVESMLAAAAGQAQLQRKDYVRARAALAQAVTATPDDPRLVYSLALADLSGDKPNRQQGYWLLARAVNLFGGPARARAIEEFGRNQYKEDGGTDRDWDQYLAVAAAPGANAAAAIAATAAPSTTTVATKTAAPRSTVAKAEKPKNKPSTMAANRTPISGTGWKGEVEPPAESTAAANSLPPIGEAARPTVRTGPPVSLGILIETSVARKPTRDAIVYSLTDLVRRLGPEDEAFILSFSNDLVFEQDLTGDSQRLEQALDTIKPQSGTALLDAVAFAAGHLRRISKNESRVLLVISDGQNTSSRIPALASSNEIRASGVKIYCIGVDVPATEAMYRLQALATGTGGTASFITAPGQFRGATQQVANRMGIHFEY